MPKNNAVKDESPATVNLPSEEETLKEIEETFSDKPKIELPVSKPGAIKDGFLFALVGASVKNEKDEVIRREYTRKGMGFTVNNCEAPVPTNDHAAALAAADCETQVFKLDENGKIVKHKLTGLAAAVTLALLANNDSIGQGAINGKFPNEGAVRKAFAEKYTFTMPEAVQPTEIDVKAAIAEAIARCIEDPSLDQTAEVMKAIASVGVRMKVKPAEKVVETKTA